MNQIVGPRVFALDALTGVAEEVPLAQACEHAGMLVTAATTAPAAWPRLAAALRARGAAAVLVIADASASTPASDSASASASASTPAPHRHWLDAAHARGWVTPQAGGDIDGDRLPAVWQARLALAHVPADAALLAWPALPWLAWLAWTDPPGGLGTPPMSTRHAMDPPLGLYAIVDAAAALRSVLKAGVRTVQLRVKRPADADAAWNAALRDAIRDSVAAADGHGARLFINDHWRLAAELGARAVHLGQEDLLALTNLATPSSAPAAWAWASVRTPSGSCAGRAAWHLGTSPAARSGRRPPRTCPGNPRAWTTWPGGAVSRMRRWWPSAAS